MAPERQHLEAIAAIDPDEAMQQQSTQSSSFAASTANDRFGQFRTFQSACPICTQELTPPADPARLTFALAPKPVPLRTIMSQRNVTCILE